MAIIFAAGADDSSSVFESVFSVTALTVSAVWVCFSPDCSAVALGSDVDDFCFASVVGGVVSSAGAVVSCVGVVVPEVVSDGFGFSVVGSVVAVGVEVALDDVEPVEDGGFSCDTVVPDPPEALTVDVGPSPAVVVDDCEPDDEVVVVVVVVVVGSVPVVAPDVPPVPPEPDVVVPESVVVVAFEPVSVSGEPEVELSPVVADAMP